jgi:predicted permease
MAWSRFFRRGDWDKERSREIQSYIDIETDENIGRGMSPEEARYAALRRFGNVALIREEIYRMNTIGLIETIGQDLRYALRSMIRAPWSSFAIVGTLGLAMGANIAVFGLIDTLVLRPLPVEKPSELVIVSAPGLPRKGPSLMVSGRGKGNQQVRGMSYPLFTELRDRLNVVHGMLAHYSVQATMLSGSDTLQTHGVITSGNYFELLGVKAHIGRTLTPDDDRPAGSRPVVVITHGFWQRQFGGDPAILSRTVRLNQQPMTIVGVTASGFTGTVSGRVVDFFAPVCMAGVFMRTPGFRYDSPAYHFYTVMARLAPGVEIKQAERVADQLYQQLLAEAVRQNPWLSDKDRRLIATYHLTLLPGGYASSQMSALSRDLNTPLTILMAMVALVLVVAAGNVANLLLARGAAHARETAIQFALGSTRLRMLRERVIESLLLSLAAAGVGYLLASWTSSLAPVALNVESLPAGVTSAPDYRASLVAIGLAFATGLGIWAASALRATRQSTLPALIEHSGIGGHPRALLWRRGLVITQVALSLVLLCASVVLSRSLMNLMSVDPGFSTDNLYSFSVRPDQAGYSGPRASTYLTQVLEQVERLPGVRAASMTTDLPLTGGPSGTWVIGDQASAGGQQAIPTDIISIGPAYLRTLEMPLLFGREFTGEDNAGSVKVAMLNESLARKLFGRNDVIGRRIGFEGGKPEIEVVGVVKDTKSRTLRSPITPTLFLPASQEQTVAMTFVLRTARQGITNEMVRTVLKRIDPSVAVVEFGSVAGQIARSLYRDRMLASLSLCFAGLASLLCAIGVFGLTSFSVTRRTKEIGVRMALGATRASIHWLAMKEVSLLAVLGCAAGLVAFIVSSRVLSSLLFELAPSDPASLVLSTIVLGGTTFLAGFLPAHRAARLDPSRTLRED